MSEQDIIDEVDNLAELVLGAAQALGLSPMEVAERVTNEVKSLEELSTHNESGEEVS